ANSLRSDSAGPFTFAAPGITKSAWRKALRTNLQGHLKLRWMLMSVVYWSFIENHISFFAAMTCRRIGRGPWKSDSGQGRLSI
ncbi:MAG: hypothetical protein P8X55_08360, partial [Desulfosarcinaceae bacterium]